MKLITQRQLIQVVAERWRNTYPPGRHGYGPDNKDEILKRLKAIDLSTVPAEEVNRIIGNNSWTTIRCDECELYVDAAVQVGAPPDYESSTAMLCERCVAQAVATFGGKS